MSSRRRTTWREKLADDKGLPKVIEITGTLSRRWGTGTCAIPAPREAAGRKRITPWWRVLKEGGKLNPKFPRGIAEHARRLRAEGHTVIPGRGKQPPSVADWGRKLAKLRLRFV